MRAESARAQVAATIPKLEASIAAKESEISALLGRAPGPIPRGVALAARKPAPSVPAGLPSGLLERRPDVQTSEGLLRAANERIGVAYAGFFPRIGITGVLGVRSDELENLMDAGSDTWS